MSFLRRLFRLDPESHVGRGDAFAAQGEWGLAHLEYDKAFLAIDESSESLRGSIEAKRSESAEQIYQRNLERARTERVDIGPTVGSSDQMTSRRSSTVRFSRSRSSRRIRERTPAFAHSLLAA